jgi:hypothetical protein
MDNTLARQAGTEYSTGYMHCLLSFDARDERGESFVYVVEGLHASVDISSPLFPVDPGKS